MRLTLLLTITWFTLLTGLGFAAEAPPRPQIGPPFAEIEAAWTAFWTAITLGDVKDARRYLHTRQQDMLGRGLTPAQLREWQALAYQMSYCRLDPTPFPHGMIDEKALRDLPPRALEEIELYYWVRCKYGDETAETMIGIRGDVDGVWRLVLH
jgi:hypothetical protein